jgi:hypothetical protein
MSKAEKSELVKLKINLDYDWKDCPLPYQQLTYNYVSYAVNNTYKEGLDGAYLRMWGRIQRKFEKAVEDKKNSIDLNLDEAEFITKARRPVKYPPQDAKYVNVLDEELDQLRV